MSKRKDIHKILVIGSGPSVIGQNGEYDYVGTEACKTLRHLGYEVIVANSNPASIMTDPNLADQTYIEPLNVECLTRIIEKERPDAVLPNLGGQNGLNLCALLYKQGVLNRNGVKILGTPIGAITSSEDRVAFKKILTDLGIETVPSEACYGIEEARACANRMGYPVILRPAYTMSGAGGGIVYNDEELERVFTRGLKASLIGQVLVEQSLHGWQELELEVLRDEQNHMITAGAVENVDPVGIHTGDSLCVLPMLTIPQDVQDRLQHMAYTIMEAMKVTGSMTVQFAYDRHTDRIIVIEGNMRLSRTSSLVAKGTGLCVPSVAVQLALGVMLDELPYEGEKTLVDYAPDMADVVVKLPRWSFKHLGNTRDILDTHMRSLGEVMAFGKDFSEAFVKATESLHLPSLAQRAATYDKVSDTVWHDRLATASPERYAMIYAALSQGLTSEAVADATDIHPYFIERIQSVVANGTDFGTSHWHMTRVFGEDETGCFYSSSQGEDVPVRSDERQKVVLIGSGPNRLGESIEFDYACVHASKTLQKEGFYTVLINSNPAAVSTDCHSADAVYIEPITADSIQAVCRRENSRYVIVQFGGESALALTAQLEAAGLTVVGTSSTTLEQLADRTIFMDIMKGLSIPSPQSIVAATEEAVLESADSIGYPVMVRSAYTRSGQWRDVLFDAPSLRQYLAAIESVSANTPIMVQQFLRNAVECEVDAVGNGIDVYIPAFMEHIELAGIHSGDSACIVPGRHITANQESMLRDYISTIVRHFHIVGMVNIHFAIADDTIYVMSLNLRASRTVPLVSKVCGTNLIALAARVLSGAMGKEEPNLKALEMPAVTYWAVKEAVFPFSVFPEADPALGPEMRSTGEVVGLANSTGEAFFKAEEAADALLPLHGSVIISVSDADKPYIAELAQNLAEDDFTLYATDKTYDLLQAAFIPVSKVNKIGEPSPTIEELVYNGDIQMVINTPSSGKGSAHDDGALRKAAIRAGIPYFTTIVAAKAAAEGIHRMITHGRSDIHSLQEWYKQ